MYDRTFYSYVLSSFCLIDQGDISTFSVDCASVINSSLECEKTHDSELMALDQMNNTELENSSKIAAVSTESV